MVRMIAQMLSMSPGGSQRAKDATFREGIDYPEPSTKGALGARLG